MSSPKSDLKKTKPEDWKKSEVDVSNDRLAKFEAEQKFVDSDGEEVDLSPCAGLRMDLMFCLLNSDCVRKDGRDPEDCVQVFQCPSECYNIRNQFYRCKRNQVDAKKRSKEKKSN